MQTDLRPMQNYVTRSVPMAGKMGLKLKALDDQGVRFHVPLRPNRNHIGTAFGGTLVAAQAVACWTWLTWALEDAGVGRRDKDFTIVIESCVHKFRSPVCQDFEIISQAPRPRRWQALVKALKGSGKVRLVMRARVTSKSKDKAAGEFTGRYVILMKDRL